MDEKENDILAEEYAAEAEEVAPPPREAAPADTLRILEALLFASDEQLSAARFKAILPGNPDAREIAKMVERINRNLQKERHPFEIVEIGGGYQFKTIAYYHPWVRQIFQEKAAKRLSMQALECLSIIAYRQPLSKAEIESIRGVLSDGAMKTLLEKRLITITGRSDKPGRPLLYGTTQEFLHYFGLGKITDLPKIEEFEAMARQKVEDLPIEELKNVHEQALAEAAAEEATIEITLPEQRPEAFPAPTPAAGTAGGAPPARRPEETAVFEVSLPPKTNEIIEETDIVATGDVFERVATEKPEEAPAAAAAPEPETLPEDDEVRHAKPPAAKRKKTEAKVIKAERNDAGTLSTDGETVCQAAITEEKILSPVSDAGAGSAEAVFEVSVGAQAPGKQPSNAQKKEDAAPGDDAVFEKKL